MDLRVDFKNIAVWSILSVFVVALGFGWLLIILPLEVGYWKYRVKELELELKKKENSQLGKKIENLEERLGSMPKHFKDKKSLDKF